MDWKKAFQLGFLVWLLPFAFSFLFYDSHAKLTIDGVVFKNIMFSFLIIVTTIATPYLFKGAHGDLSKVGVNAGMLWVAISIVFDLLFLVGFFGMSLYRYFTEIGLGYICLFAIPAAAGMVAQTHRNARK